MGAQMENVKNKAIALLGAVLLFIGVLFIILPGPAILFIPLGLVLLSFEYPIAKQWLKKYQRYSRKTAVQMDNMVRKVRRY